MTAPFERLESNSRTYCRKFPVLFTAARGHTLWDENGRAYLDFLSGAGALNYGHHHPALKAALLEYLAGDGPVHALDLYTAAKARLLKLFEVVGLEDPWVSAQRRRLSAILFT